MICTPAGATRDAKHNQRGRGEQHPDAEHEDPHAGR